MDTKQSNDNHKQWLAIKNWGEFQHYKYRNPAWIKLHSGIIVDFEFCKLSRPERGLLMQLWIVASRFDGQIPQDVQELRFLIHDNTIEQQEIDKLIETGFLVVPDASTTLAASTSEGTSTFCKLKLDQSRVEKSVEREKEKKPASAAMLAEENTSIDALPNSSFNEKEEDIHPAIKAYQSATFLYPDKAWWKDVIKYVGDSAPALRLWYDICHKWVGLGRNPNDTASMLVLFKKGELPEAGQ